MTRSKRGFDLVRTIALALPDVEEGTSWGATAFKLHGKMMACQPTNKAAEPDSLVVMLDFPQRDELLAAEPDVYYLKEHYEGYPCLLVRLKKVHPDALRDLLAMAWSYMNAKTKRKPQARGAKRRAVRARLVIACLLGSALNGEARQAPDAIARAVVIGQAYASGNVYVAGFVEDEPRPWPQRIQLWPLRKATNEVMAAAFFRTVTQDSEEQQTFPGRETDADSMEPDVFSTIDRMAVTDRNLARYRASTSILKPLSIVAWDERLPLVEIEVFVQGPPRPLTARERVAVEADKKAGPKNPSQCTTVPQYLDAATLLLTARLADSQTRIRLSYYATPGCAGHLSEIYVLDVIVAGEEPRRYEFRHYQGLL